MPANKVLPYETDSGKIFYVRLEDSPGIPLVSGTAPDGVVTENITLKSNRNKKAVGLKPRKVLLARTITGVADNTSCLVQSAKLYKRVPVLRKAWWDTLELDSSVVIRNENYTIVKKLPEERA